MNRSIVVYFSFLFFVAAVSARAQVTESANSHRSTIYAGGEGSMFQPDYAGNGIPQSNPQRLYGIGTYVDDDITRWIQIEAEGRWLNWKQYAGVDENTYLIGPRVPIIQYKRFKPYGKFLIGMGGGSFLTGRTTVMAFGGGLDVRLSNKITLRAFDYEFQDWRVGAKLIPSGGSVGVSYCIF